MAYDHNELYKRSKKAITDNRLFFIADVARMIGIAQSTWYEHFPVESEEYKELSELIQQNKIMVKVSQRAQWLGSQNATLQLALYRLIATPEERRALNQQYIDHTTQGKEIAPIAWDKLDEETIEKLYNAATNNPEE